MESRPARPGSIIRSGPADVSSYLAGSAVAGLLVKDGGWTMQRNCDDSGGPDGRCRRSCWSLAGGCTSVKVTGTARTGTEQLLLTGTWDDALCRVEFPAACGQRRSSSTAQYMSPIVDKD